jgi:hypothetical protein
MNMMCSIATRELSEMRAEDFPEGAWFANEEARIMYAKKDPFMDGDVLLSDDGGRVYREAAGRGFGGTVDKHELSFIDVLGPTGQSVQKLNRDHNVVLYDGRYFTQFIPAHHFEIVPLPDERKSEYLCEAEDGTIIYVSAAKYKYSYESFRLFVGREAGQACECQPVPIRDVERFRDGGTTNVFTDAEMLHVPPPRQRGTMAAWWGVPPPAGSGGESSGYPSRRVPEYGRRVVVHDPSKFSIVETDSVVVVQRMVG